MSNPVTLKDLMVHALQLADYPTIDKIDPDLREQLKGWVNEGLAYLYDLMVAADTTADYYLKVETYTLTSGQEDYALPTDFYKLKKVYFLSAASEGRRYRIERFDLNNIDGYKMGPLTTGTVELWYVPQFKLLVRENDIVDQMMPPTWEHMGVYFAAAHLAEKEDRDGGKWDGDRAELVARVQQMAEPRDEGEPDTILDTTNRWAPLVRSMWAYEYRYKYRLMGPNIKFLDVRFQGI